MAFKLSPELSDGQNECIVKYGSEVAELVAEWCDNIADYGATGESCTIEYIEMSDAEIDALPDL